MNKPETDLKFLIDRITERYVCDERKYPVLAKLSGTEREVFVVKHSMAHMNKSVGKIATEVEVADHGGFMNIENLKASTTKMFISTLKLAQELKMTPEELAQGLLKEVH
jgi:hypothetical protein